MADISKVTVNGTEYNVKDASAPARPLGDGYSKTGTLPISPTDTISEAIGKLESTTETKIGSSDYGSQNTGGTVRVWTTTVGSDTVLHISNQAAT